MDLVGLVVRATLALHAPATTPALAATLVEAPAAVAAIPASADATVAKIQAFYAGLDHVTATFHQPVVNATFGTTTVNEGTVAIKRPGKLRWDYLSKKKTLKKAFITDGASLYLVEPASRRVTEQHLAGQVLPAAVAFLAGKGDLLAEFTAAFDTSGTYGDAKTQLVLKLVPKQPSAQYQALYLVADRADFHVAQSIVIDASGNQNQFEFGALDAKAELDDARFRVDPASYPGYSFVTLRSTAPNTPARRARP
jgi:outer membrane lipoprotein carrier protein